MDAPSRLLGKRQQKPLMQRPPRWLLRHRADHIHHGSAFDLVVSDATCRPPLADGWPPQWERAANHAHMFVLVVTSLFLHELQALLEDRPYLQPRIFVTASHPHPAVPTLQKTHRWRTNSYMQPRLRLLVLPPPLRLHWFPPHRSLRRTSQLERHRYQEKTLPLLRWPQAPSCRPCVLILQCLLLDSLQLTVATPARQRRREPHQFQPLHSPKGKAQPLWHRPQKKHFPS
mmetsp:Transcript_30607/g.81422  ORF Transcript_30607/g.81422 Transcript_30607/m.81422 type:complete len:230 (+) Transcript_30607:179-868(+)